MGNEVPNKSYKLFIMQSFENRQEVPWSTFKEKYENPTHPVTGEKMSKTLRWEHWLQAQKLDQVYRSMCMYLCIVILHTQLMLGCVSKRPTRPTMPQWCKFVHPCRTPSLVEEQRTGEISREPRNQSYLFYSAALGQFQCYLVSAVFHLVARVPCPQREVVVLHS